MKTLTTVGELLELYPPPVERAIRKVQPHITPLYRAWISESHFLVLASVGPSGIDASPRGDDGAVAHIADEKTVLIPDWKGNNRLDSLRNIVLDGRVSLMFFVQGCDNVVRVNGTASLTAEEPIRAIFQKDNKLPTTVISVAVAEIYFQCAKALMRSKLWSVPEPAPTVPSAGDFQREFDENFNSESYDAGYAEYARSRMW